MKKLPETIKHAGKTYVLDKRATARHRQAAQAKRSATGERMTGRLRQAEYQGWKNYETWHVNLVWANEYGDYLHWTETAQSVLNDHEGDKKEAKVTLAGIMEESVDEGFEALDIPMFYNALLGSAIEDIDFWEIAESWLEELEYEGEEEDEDEEE